MEQRLNNTKINRHDMSYYSNVSDVSDMERSEFEHEGIPPGQVHTDRIETVTPGQVDTDTTVVFLGNLAPGITIEEVRNIVRGMAGVLDIAVGRLVDVIHIRECAFIETANRNVAQELIQKYHKMLYGGRGLVARLAGAMDYTNMKLEFSKPSVKPAPRGESITNKERSPLIGMRYIIEYIDSGTASSGYFCYLCHTLIPDWSFLVSHIMSNDHMLNYVEIVQPDAHKVISAIPSDLALLKELLFTAAEIEKKEGRQTITIVYDLNPADMNSGTAVSSSSVPNYASFETLAKIAAYSKQLAEYRRNKDEEKKQKAQPKMEAAMEGAERALLLRKQIEKRAKVRKWKEQILKKEYEEKRKRREKVDEVRRKREQERITRRKKDKRSKRTEERSKQRENRRLIDRDEVITSISDKKIDIEDVANTLADVTQVNNLVRTTNAIPGSKGLKEAKEVTKITDEQREKNRKKMIQEIRKMRDVQKMEDEKEKIADKERRKRYNEERRKRRAEARQKERDKERDTVIVDRTEDETKTLPEDVKGERTCRLSEIIEDNEAAMLGLHFITEHCEGSSASSMKYTCSLCHCTCGSDYIIPHITGLQHRMLFLKQFHEEEFRKVSAITDLGEKRSQLEVCAKLIEVDLGREDISVELLSVNTSKDGSIKEEWTHEKEQKSIGAERQNKSETGELPCTVSEMVEEDDHRPQAASAYLRPSALKASIYSDVSDEEECNRHVDGQQRELVKEKQETEINEKKSMEDGRQKNGKSIKEERLNMAKEMKDEGREGDAKEDTMDVTAGEITCRLEEMIQDNDDPMLAANQSDTDDGMRGTPEPRYSSRTPGARCKHYSRHSTSPISDHSSRRSTTPDRNSTYRNRRSRTPENRRDVHRRWSRSPESRRGYGWRSRSPEYRRDYRKQSSRSRSPVRRRQKPRSANRRWQKLRSPDRGSPKSRSPDRRRQKTISPDRRRQKSRSPDRRWQKLRSPDRGRQKSRSADRRRLKSRSPDRRSQKSRSPDRGSQKSRSPSRGSQKSRSPDRQSQKSRSPDRGTRKSRSPDRETRKSRSPDRGRQKIKKSNPTDKKMAFTAQLYAMLKGLDDTPLVGLSYIVEEWGTEHTTYTCKLCSRTFQQGEVIDHIKNIRHKSKFLEQKYPAVYSLSQDKVSSVEKQVAVIEKNYGRESISVLVQPDTDPVVVPIPRSVSMQDDVGKPFGVNVTANTALAKQRKLGTTSKLGRSSTEKPLLNTSVVRSSEVDILAAAAAAAVDQRLKRLALDTDSPAYKNDNKEMPKSGEIVTSEPGFVQVAGVPMSTPDQMSQGRHSVPAASHTQNITIPGPQPTPHIVQIPPGPVRQVPGPACQLRKPQNVSDKQFGLEQPSRLRTVVQLASGHPARPSQRDSGSTGAGEDGSRSRTSRPTLIQPADSHQGPIYESQSNLRPAADRPTCVVAPDISGDKMIPDTFTDQFTIPEGMLDLAIGVDCANIRAARKLKGITSITVNGEQSLFTVTGTKVSVDAARTMLEFGEMTYKVPRKFVVPFMGTDGCNVQNILDMTGAATVQVQGDEETGCLPEVSFVFVGNRDSLCDVMDHADFNINYLECTSDPGSMGVALPNP